MRAELQEVSELLERVVIYTERNTELENRIKQLEKETKKLRTALQPFAAIYKRRKWVSIRRASKQAYEVLGKYAEPSFEKVLAPQCERCKAARRAIRSSAPTPE